MSDGTPPPHRTQPDLPPVEAGQDPLIGTRIGEYEVLAPLAEGGMGMVYRGVHPVIKKRVAIKVLKAITGNESGHMQQLAAEAEAVNSIGHRNIVDIFGMGLLPDGRPYIIMEYLEGKALDAHFEEHERRLPVTEVVEILFEMCAPLAAAHKARVIHRDLKPSNVFLCTQPDGSRFLKLLDFGLAKKAARLDGITEQTSQKSVAGTPDYMAPEHAQGKAISPRTDLYALGCIGFFLLTGRLPFLGETPMDMMIAHVRAPVPRVSGLDPTVPPELDELVFRMMQKAPDERPQSADEVREVLRQVLEALGTPVGVPGAATFEGAARTTGSFAAHASAPKAAAPAVAGVATPPPSAPPVLDGAGPALAAEGAAPAKVATPSPRPSVPRGAGPVPSASRAAVGSGSKPSAPGAGRVTGSRSAHRPEGTQAPAPRAAGGDASGPPVLVPAAAAEATPAAATDETGPVEPVAEGRPIGLLVGLAVASLVVVGGGLFLVFGQGPAKDPVVEVPEPPAPPPDRTAPHVARDPAAPATGSGPSNPGTAAAATGTGGAPAAAVKPGDGKPPAAHAGPVKGEELAPVVASPTPAGKRAPEPKAPTEAEIKARLTALEGRLRQKTPKGAELDPAALQLLAKYRVQATMADTPAERVKLWRSLDQWDRLFLQR